MDKCLDCPGHNLVEHHIDFDQAAHSFVVDIGCLLGYKVVGHTKMADRKTVVGHKKLDSDKNLQLDKELDLHLKALRKAED